MNDVQNFIDELKNVRKLIEDPRPKITKYDDAINMIENIIGKYQAIIDENERKTMSIRVELLLDNQEQAHDRMDYYYDREKKLKDILTSLAEVKKILERQLKEVTDEIDKYENENFESISARDIEDAIEQ